MTSLQSRARAHLAKSGWLRDVSDTLAFRAMREAAFQVVAGMGISVLIFAPMLLGSFEGLFHPTFWLVFVGIGAFCFALFAAMNYGELQERRKIEDRRRRLMERLDQAQATRAQLRQALDHLDAVERAKL